MKKDGEEILSGVSLKMETLHKRATGKDIEGGLEKKWMGGEKGGGRGGKGGGGT